jgi:hypothetical protein
MKPALWSSPAFEETGVRVGRLHEDAVAGKLADPPVRVAQDDAADFFLLDAQDLS